jgi:uncharacterized cupin superfamily protein
MSGRGWDGAAVSAWDKRNFAHRYTLAGLIVLAYMACISNVASADVDSVGGLEKVPTIKSSPHELAPLAGGAGLYQCSSAYQYADIHSEPWGFVIGQCRPGWKFEVLEHTGVNSEHHTSSYGGYLEGAFDACGWIESDEGPEQINEKLPNHCPGLNQKKSTVGTFYEKYNGEPAPTGDGYYIVNKAPCKEYANSRPWSSGSVEKEEIRTVPAYATEKTDIPALKWRYVTEYASTDGSGKYVMVRDTRYNGGEGNWVFVPLSCLRANASELPESEGELVPSPPTATTGTPTGIATPNATLVGFVNPNGLDTKYFFEYGTTTSYGSYTTTEDAGSGTGVVQEDAPISGLAPGTTYYFRIVASSATGESFGGPVAFTTQPAPAVATGSASEIGQFQAQLNSSVNPEGLETHYHFEYGETTSYGSSTAVGNAGAGPNPVAAPAEAAVLKPSTTYHFRVVATSSAGTTDGADATFTTHGSTAPAVVRESVAPGRQWVYYPTAQSNIEGLYWSSASWSAFDLWPSAPTVAQGTSASAVLESGEGQQWVYYQTAQGNIEGLYWDASAGKWEAFDDWPSAPAAAPGTSPSAVLESGEGQMWVYYQTAQGNIEGLYWDASAGKWSVFEPVPGALAAAPGTTPIAVLDQKTGKQWIYYHTAQGNIEGLYWNNAGSWSAFDMWPSAPAAAPGTSPTVNIESGVGQQWVYYQAAEGNIEGLYWDASAGKWEPFDMWPSAPTAAQGTSPSAVYESGVGQQWVYYHTAQGTIDALYWDASAGKWFVFEPVPGALAAAPWTSPAVIRESGVGQQWVYYVAAQGNIEGLYWDASAGKWEAFDQWAGAPPA